MNKTDCKGIWVFAEQENGVINPAVYEVLGKASELKEHNGEELCAVLLGEGIKNLSASLIAQGADKVYVVDCSALRNYSARPYQQAITQLAEKHHPLTILYAATCIGRDLAPRVMVSLRTGLTADAVDLGYDDEGVFYQTTPAYGGKLMANIVIREKRPQMATVRPGTFSPLPCDPERKGSTVMEELALSADDGFKILEITEKPTEEVSIDEATILVSAGRGVKNETELNMLRDLAAALGGELASSRPLVDSGMLPHSRQIGQSGQSVKPEMIINTAISGSIQYMAGMKCSNCIVSINKDKDAPIFDASDYGVVEDFKKFIPVLINEIEKRRKKIIGRK